MKNNFEMPLNEDKTPNLNYIDLLEEDKPIAGQKFACVSFVSPENILKQKQNYYFENFLSVWDFTKSCDKFKQFLSFMAHKYSVSTEVLFQDYDDFCNEEKDYLKTTVIEDDYKTFIDNNEENLEKEFDKKHSFQTSVRSVKIRGVFSTQEEAELRCKMLRESDPNHDVYVGPIGMWMPWEPEAYKTGRVEYLEPELNQLMHEKVKNDKKANEEFEKRLRETKQKAIHENIKKAKKSGNKLSQNIDKDGNLYDVNVGNSNDMNSVADISKELFENENVVPKGHDGGAAQLLENKALHENTVVGENNIISLDVEETPSTETQQ